MLHAVKKPVEAKEQKLFLPANNTSPVNKLAKDKTAPIIGPKSTATADGLKRQT